MSVSAAPATADVALRAAAWVGSVTGEPVTVEGCVPTAGNAGRGFRVELRTGGARRTVALRLAAAGVAESGSNDVLGQAALARHLTRHTIPVPAVVWSTDDPRWFGASAVAYEWVDGLPLHMFRADLSTPEGADRHEALVLAAVEVLTAIHRVPAPGRGAGAVDPAPSARPAGAEVARWDGVLDRVARDPGFEPALIESCRSLGAELAATAVATPAGLVHGDYQTHNVLFRDGRVVAVVDWELAGTGPQLLDVAWLTMFCDPSSWHPGLAGRNRLRVDPGVVRDRAVGGLPDAAGLSWCEALARYRFAAMTLYNLRLHRTGRRRDDIWESFAQSVPALVRSAGERLVQR